MIQQNETQWDWLTKEATAAVKRCENVGHCYHEGTAKGSYYCGRCGERREEYNLQLCTTSYA